MLDLKLLCSPWFYLSKSLNLPCYQYLSPIFLLVLNLCFFIMSIFSPCFPCFSPCCCIFTRFFPCFFQHFAPHGPTARPMAEAPGHGLSGAAATRGMAEADAVAVQRLHSGCAMECTEGSVCCGGKAMGKMGKLWKRYPGWWFQTFFIFHNVWDNHDNPSH